MDIKTLEKANELQQKIKWYRQTIDQYEAKDDDIYIDVGHATITKGAYEAVREIILNDLNQQLVLLEGQFDQL